MSFNEMIQETLAKNTQAEDFKIETDVYINSVLDKLSYLKHGFDSPLLCIDLEGTKFDTVINRISYINGKQANLLQRYNIPKDYKINKGTSIKYGLTQDDIEGFFHKVQSFKRLRRANKFPFTDLLFVAGCSLFLFLISQPISLAMSFPELPFITLSICGALSFWKLNRDYRKTIKSIKEMEQNWSNSIFKNEHITSMNLDNIPQKMRDMKFSELKKLLSNGTLKIDDFIETSSEANDLSNELQESEKEETMSFQKIFSNEENIEMQEVLYEKKDTNNRNRA